MHKDTNQLKGELRELIADVVDIERDTIRDDADLVEDLEVDSVMMLEVMVALEKTFGLKLVQDDLANIRSLNQMTGFIAAKLAEVAAKPLTV